ncbi:MAG: hypothetical protein ACOYBW_06685 [Fluviibacter phosphoraccumulans]
MSVDELAASAIRALDEIYFMLRNFDVNSPDAISDLDQVCEFCVYLSKLEPQLRGGKQEHAEVADQIAALRLACETLAGDAYFLG